MVKRYYQWCAGTHGHALSESPEGNLVSYTDYELLEKALALEKKLGGGFSAALMSAEAELDAVNQRITQLEKTEQEVLDLSHPNIKNLMGELDAANKRVEEMEKNGAELTNCDTWAMYVDAVRKLKSSFSADRKKWITDREALEKERDELKLKHEAEIQVSFDRYHEIAELKATIRKIKDAYIVPGSVSSKYPFGMAWPEKVAELTQSNDAMREGINDFLNVYKEEGIVKFHYLEDAIQKEEEK